MRPEIMSKLTRQELETRFDANETAFLARQLEFVRSKVYEVQYAELLARRFMPMATDIPSSAETYVYYVYDAKGKAKVSAHGNDDLPRVDVQGSEVTGKVRPMTVSYGWDLNSMREAARVGTPLNDMKARAARRAIETLTDELLFNGTDSSQPGKTFGFTGLVNNADVTGLGVINPGNDPWSAATATQILDDMNAIVQTVVTASKQRWLPDTLLFAPNEFNIIAQKSVGTDNQMTILRSFLANNPYIRNIDQWHRLTLAGAGGTTNRAVCYKRDPEVLEAVVPQEFEQLPPQARNLEFVVPCHARCGGVKVYHPQAIRYADFTP